MKTESITALPKSVTNVTGLAPISVAQWPTLGWHDDCILRTMTMKQMLENSVKDASAMVTEARFQVRDAIQTSNVANVIWWEKQLKLRQSVLRELAQKLEWEQAALSQAQGTPKAKE